MTARHGWWRGAAITVAAAGVVLAAIAGPWLAAPLAAAAAQRVSEPLGVEVQWAGAGITPGGWLALRDVRVIPPNGTPLIVPRCWLHAGWPRLLRRQARWDDHAVQFVIAGVPILGFRPRLEGTYTAGVINGRASWGLLRLPVSAAISPAAQRLRAADLQINGFQASSGELDLGRGTWTIMARLPSAGPVTVTGLLSDAHPRADIILHDVKAGPVAVSTTVRLAAQWPPASLELAGTVATAGTTLNRQPVRDLDGRWRLRHGRLEVPSLIVGPCRVSGSIGLGAPHPLQMTVEMTELDAARVASIIEPGKPPLAGGIVTGRIHVAGTPEAPKVDGALTARDGKLGGTTFDTANVQFAGDGPILRFSDTQLRQPSAVVNVEGFLDVTKLGTPTVFQDMRLVSQPLRDLSVGRVARHQEDDEA